MNNERGKNYTTENINTKKEQVTTCSLSGYQDSNLGPPAPKAGALTGLRYTPNDKFIGLLTFSRKRCKGTTIFLTTKTFQRKFYIKIKKIFTTK